MRKTVRLVARPEHVALGRLIRELRESRHLTQRDLAKALGRTQAFVWKVEQGHQHLDIATLIDLARILGTSAALLVAKVESGESPVDT